MNPLTDNVYICDLRDNCVQVFTKNIAFLFDFEEMMDCPVGICINQGKVFVTQHCFHSPNVYSTEMKFLSSVEKEGKRKIEFHWLRVVAVSNEKERIYICDYFTDGIQCLNLDYTFHSFIENILSPEMLS